ncbi:ABC transporter substrate-binding protein [Anaerocolumna jejuensis]|uniref:ABC transporter substrate-binding protein n=1 Tax=Anaerocolumna jejuensis TaxID=259063 RepID=UPI003F7CC4D7
MQKMVKRIISMGIALMLMFSLSACGSGNNGDKSKENGTAGSAGSKETGGEASKEDPAELTMAFLIFGSVPNDMQKVNDAINTYLLDKVNCKLKMVPINASNYSQQIDLMLTSGETLDLLADGTITAFFNYTSHAAKGQLYPMNDLLGKYGEGIKKALGDYTNAASVNGEVYGVATNRDLAARTSFICRTSLLKKYNIDPSTIKTYDDLENMFKTIKNKETGVTPAMIGQTASGTIFDSMGLSFDTNGDQLSDMIGVLMDNQKLKVSNYYETDLCKAAALKAYDWYKKGYILQDATTNQSSGEDLVKAGSLFGFFGNSKPGIEKQETSLCGEEMTEIVMSDTLSDTQKVTGFMWSIAAGSKYPEKAMQVLDLMYTDPTFVNLLDHGIEGTHYQMVDKDKGIIDYPEGINSSSSGYDMGVDFEFGNQMLSYIWNGDSPTLWNDLDSFNKSAIVSKAMGFQFDSTNVKAEYAAVTSVIDKYKRALGQGTVNPNKVLPEFIEMLQKAGIDTIIKEKQTQLDTFAKSNNIQ